MRCSCMLKSSLGMSGPTLQDSGMKSFWMLNLDDVHPCLVDAKICNELDHGYQLPYRRQYIAKCQRRQAACVRDAGRNIIEG